MRITLLGGLLGLVLAAALGQAGETKKEPPFQEGSTSDLSALLGNWQAAIATKGGWTGTLRGTATLKRNHPEDATFHTLLVVSYDLRHDEVKTPVRGSESIALVPYQKGKQRHVQCLRDFQVLQKEYLTEVLEIRPNDKKARQGMAELRPSARNTAGYTLTATTWTLETAPIVLEFLPQRAAEGGPALDWDGKLVWRKVKTK